MADEPAPEPDSEPDPGPRDRNPADSAMPHWEQVVDDVAATAAAYRERGWDAVEIHPGDVQVRGPELDRSGFELLAPDDEFDRLAAAVDRGGGFESADVYRAAPSGTVYAAVALEDAATRTAALLPLHFLPHRHRDLVEAALDEGAVRIHVRPLDERRVLTFVHEDPALFLPEEA